MKELKLPPFMENIKDNFIQVLRHKIMTVCEEHKIRLTPKEYEELVTYYYDSYFNNIDVSSLLQFAENIKRRS